MILTLDDEACADAAVTGSKAATLARLRAAGFPVPEGFVVPADVEDASLPAAVARGLRALGLSRVAVRSSGLDEDGRIFSAAGQYSTVLGVSGVDAVAQAVLACRASVDSDRARAYRDGREVAALPVLIQRLIDAEQAGVLFTPPHPAADVTIEAAPGLGVAVVGGLVDPDAFAVSAAGSVRARLRHPRSRLDADGGGGLIEARVRKGGATLGEETARELAEWGRRIARYLGSAQDIEWAIADSRVSILQARPVTAVLPAWTDGSGAGIPGASGRATGAARPVDGPATFGSVAPGDILICRTTDPGWTPLLRIASAVVTETGGALSHAAIIAREFGIPAVLGIADARRRFPAGQRLLVDGDAGTVTVVPVRDPPEIGA